MKFTKLEVEKQATIEGITIVENKPIKVELEK